MQYQQHHCLYNFGGKDSPLYDRFTLSRFAMIGATVTLILLAIAFLHTVTAPSKALMEGRYLRNWNYLASVEASGSLPHSGC